MRISCFLIAMLATTPVAAECSSELDQASAKAAELATVGYMCRPIIGDAYVASSRRSLVELLDLAGIDEEAATREADQMMRQAKLEAENKNIGIDDGRSLSGACFHLGSDLQTELRAASAKLEEDCAVSR